MVMGFDDVYDACLRELPNLLQSREEARIVYNYILKIQPRLLMEIGAGEGGSHRLWMDAAPSDAEIIIIDLPVQVPQQKFESWKRWYKPGQRSVLFYDSQNPETFEKVKNYLAGRKLDFLFIDGDHHYEAVKRDFEWYGSLVRQGGLIVIHDTQFKTWKEFGKSVAEWWREFASTHKVEEYVYPDPRIIGTGIYVKES
jgi:predicted O-methyltransferase YrrM